jgi:CRP-like cAMP-binding protein
MAMISVVGYLHRWRAAWLQNGRPPMETEVWQKRLATLPLESYGVGETVVWDGTKTGRLLILKTGLVSIVKAGIEIAKVAEPGVVFGEISALLDKPHTADVVALAPSQFHVADAAMLLEQDPAALLYVATNLARRLDGANQALLELKNQLKAGEPPDRTDKTVERLEGLLNFGWRKYYDKETQEKLLMGYEMGFDV